MALHLARSGVAIPVVSDRSVLLPHNMARHALARPPLTTVKSEELAQELAHLGQFPKVHKGDLVVDLASVEERKILLPKQAGFAVNTTASLAVREALSVLSPKEVRPRLAEAALFGRGNGGFLLIEGAAHNPTLCDLIAELYAIVRSDRVRTLLFDPGYGLTEVQIGQGCSTLTMPMTDMRLSAMTAVLTEEFVGVAKGGNGDGQIVVGATADQYLTTTWTHHAVNPFACVDIEGADGWTMRISQRVLNEIRTEVARYSAVETGGVLIGLCSARLRAVTVVDLVPAPPDSIRTATRFVLGTEGLRDAIKSRHAASGNTLFDVGTWHSHLADQGPSSLDRETAKELAAERPPPSALLIATPTRLFGLMHRRSAL
jgi:hypothetical protein